MHFHQTNCILLKLLALDYNPQGASSPYLIKSQKPLVSTTHIQIIAK